MNDTNHIPRDMRAAISAFLNECQKEAKPFALSEALGAIRRIFPGLDVSDAELVDAIASEASTAGFDINYDVLPKHEEIERWDDEGGASAPARTEAQRHSDNDTDGARRRAKETQNRNQLV